MLSKNDTQLYIWTVLLTSYLFTAQSLLPWFPMEIVPITTFGGFE